MKYINKIKPIIVLASIVFLANCQAEKEKDFYGYGEEELAVLLTGLISNRNLVDANDGTILDQQNGLYFQKCSAGQLYRAAENDCRGRQTPSLFTPNDIVRWGAQQFAYCSNNTWACNSRNAPFELVANSGFAVPGESEAFKFCNALNNENGSPGWRLPSPVELSRLTIGGRNAMLLLFPDTQENWYWSGWGRADDLDGQTAIAVSFDREDFGEEKAFQKTDRKYVRCVRPREPVGN
ncbi:MAG: DUF1566 domain-containing protein [Leptospira sp.]|nr:DUF1566 domain-containing protein [Leptospira sp.]